MLELSSALPRVDTAECSSGCSKTLALDNFELFCFSALVAFSIECLKSITQKKRIFKLSTTKKEQLFKKDTVGVFQI